MGINHYTYEPYSIQVWIKTPRGICYSTFQRQLEVVFYLLAKSDAIEKYVHCGYFQANVIYWHDVFDHIRQKYTMVKSVTTDKQIHQQSCNFCTNAIVILKIMVVIHNMHL